MKLLRLLILFFCVAGFSYGKAPPQIHKKSKERLSPVTEITWFYLDLLTHNRAVKRQFDVLARKTFASGEAYVGGHPQVVEWFPRKSSVVAGGSFSDDARFLIIQTLSPTESPESYRTAIVAEFHVTHTGEWRFDPSYQQTIQRIISNEITVTFLGFRNLNLTP